MINQNQIVIFGAGKIGRSFIGQLFGCGGYEVVFVDVDQAVIDGLNQKGCYRVVIKGEKEEEIIVPNVRAISALDKGNVTEAVSTAGILAVSVGKNALEKIIPVIAEGLLQREKNYPGTPLDIILAENMRSAADFVREQFIKNFPSGFPVETLVGLVETSIGKMVPIIPLAELEKDPLVVFAEHYNTLILDGKGFISPIPEIKGLAPKNNIKAWVDRKAFIHNLGHATAAYYGHFLHPEAVYMYEVLDDSEVFRFTRAVMLQSAAILRTAYPEEFSASELEVHIDDLIYRFRNKALRDTIFRVGQDLVRKLGPDDRFVGIIRLAQKLNLPINKILRAMAFAFSFKALDENGNRCEQDILFDNHLINGIESALQNVCGFDSVTDKDLIEEFKYQYVAHQ
jgi:mannitol-1-phosphate 5-dehydrogenase